MLLLPRLRNLRLQSRYIRLGALRHFNDPQHTPRGIGQNRLYSHTDGGGSKEESSSRAENRLPNNLLTYGALLVTAGLTVERLFYGPPAGRKPAKETPSYGSPNDFEQAIEDLKKALSHLEDGVSTSPEDLYAHGFSANDHHPGMFGSRSIECASIDPRHAPGASHTVVVYPQSTEDVVKIVNIASRYRMPITPYSGATSLEGQFRGVSEFTNVLWALVI